MASSKYELVLNVPAIIDIKYVDVWPDKNGYGSQVSVKGTINGETQTIYLKGKSWANLTALYNGGVIGPYDKSIEEPAEKVNVPVVNGAGAVLTMQKLPADKWANLVVTRKDAGQVAATYGNGQPAPYQSPSYTSPNAPPNFLAEQDAHEAQAVRSIQSSDASTAKWNGLFSTYDKCLDFVLTVEVPKLKQAGVPVTDQGVSAMTATVMIAAKERGLAA